MNKNDYIKLIFEYKEKQTCDEFGIHVINIFYDGRIIIDQDGMDTKQRLAVLCNEIFKAFDLYDKDYKGYVKKKI